MAAMGRRRAEFVPKVAKWLTNDVGILWVFYGILANDGVTFFVLMILEKCKKRGMLACSSSVNVRNVPRLGSLLVQM